MIVVVPAWNRQDDQTSIEVGESNSVEILSIEKNQSIMKKDKEWLG